MPDISITVTDKRPVCTAGTTVVCDNSDYIVHWDLDAEWSAYDSKTMRVIYMDGTYTDTVFTGASVALPPVPVPGCVQIGLYAGDIHTSRMALLRALSSVRSASGAPANPTPDVYDQLMELIKGMGSVDPDDIAKAVADYLAAHPIEETDPTVPEWAKADITGATVGQIAKVAAVDDNGVPTEWSPVDMPTGGGGETWELINDTDMAEGAEEVIAITFSVDNNGNTFSLRKAKLFYYFPQYTGGSPLTTGAVYLKLNNTPAYCYTTGLQQPTNTAAKYGNIDIDMTLEGLQVELITKNSNFASIQSGAAKIEAITSVSIMNALMYSGCWVKLYGVRA